jgi:hypothetical protein
MKRRQFMTSPRRWLRVRSRWGGPVYRRREHVPAAGGRALDRPDQNRELIWRVAACRWSRTSS